jgi:hypothetical protein
VAVKATTSYGPYAAWANQAPVKTVPTVRPKAPVPVAKPPVSNTIRYGATDPTHPTSAVSAPQPPAAPRAPAPAPQAQPNPYGTPDDPILQQILAMSEKARTLAGGDALAALSDAGIQYGDASGLGLDASKEQAARDNPFSVLANEKRAYGQGVTSFEDSANKANLFYSGYRGTKLGELATGHQQNLAGASDRFRSLVTDINRKKTSDLMAADQADLAGRTDATGRAQARALQYGIDPGAGATDTVPTSTVSALAPAPNVAAGAALGLPPDLDQAMLAAILKRRQQGG